MQRQHLIILLLLCLTACADWVELEPTDTLLTQEAFTTRRELQSALTGVYHLVASEHLAGRNWLLFSDLMARNASLNTYGFEDFTQLTISPFNTRVDELWSTSYRAVNQLNQILAAIDAVAAEDFDFAVAEQERMRGEAHFLRAAIYFYLIRYFALPPTADAREEPGVPLVLVPVVATTDFTYPARASVGVVSDQIERDWEAAYELLPAQAPSGKPGQTAAAAYLAKLAFQRGQWAAAETWTAVVLNGAHELTATPQVFYRSEGSFEEIWCAVASANENPNFAGLNWASTAATLHQDLVDNGYQDLLSPRQQATLAQASHRAIDLRGDAGEITSDPLASAGLQHSLKYEEPGGSGDDAPLLRLAEFLLLRAETAARLDRRTEAIERLNRVRRRAFRVLDREGTVVADPAPWIDYAAEDFPTLEALLDAIARERRVELAFEGNYLHDLTRRRREVRPGVAWNDPRLRLPIPQREMDVNPNLVQNPGY